VLEIAGAAGLAPGTERVRAEHLDARAGYALGSAPRTDEDTARIREALAREHGNITRAARALGMHRTQLRRWLAVHGPDSADLAQRPHTSSIAQGTPVPDAAGGRACADVDSGTLDAGAAAGEPRRMRD
jgi:transposase-like protein